MPRKKTGDPMIDGFFRMLGRRIKFDAGGALMTVHHTGEIDDDGYEVTRIQLDLELNPRAVVKAQNRTEMETFALDTLGDCVRMWLGEEPDHEEE